MEIKKFQTSAPAIGPIGLVRPSNAGVRAAEGQMRMGQQLLPGDLDEVRAAVRAAPDALVPLTDDHGVGIARVHRQGLRPAVVRSRLRPGQASIR